MHRFAVIPPFLRTVTAGDILIPTIGNVSTFFGLQVVGEVDITLPGLVNLSSFATHPLRVIVGEVDDINLPALTNVSTFGSGSPFAAFIVVSVAPPNGIIRLPALVNTSVLEGGSPTAALVVVAEAPPDGFIRLPAFSNTSTFPTLVISEVGSGGGGTGVGDSIIAGSAIADGVIG